MTDLEETVAKVVTMMVDTFGFPPAEAQHRADLWRLEQQNLEGDLLEAILPRMSDEERAAEVLRCLLAGDDLEHRLRESAQELNLELPPQPPKGAPT